jgi:adenylylsulfate kinase
MAYIRTIAIDFDGVIASYDGWHGPDHIGAPLKGAFSFLQELIDTHHEVVIFTTRASDPAKRSQLIRWFKENGFPDNYMPGLALTNVKPLAWLYIEDRCHLFTGTYPTIAEIAAFKPWWKKDERETAKPVL